MYKRVCRHKPDPQKFTGTCADTKVKDNKMEAAQAKKPQVSCGSSKLKNVAFFKYLGSIFSANGE